MLSNQLLLLLLLVCQVFNRTTQRRHRYCNRTHRTWETMHRPQHQQPKRTINRNVPPELMHHQVAVVAPAADRPCPVLAQSLQPAATTGQQRHR
uniref:Putative secreted peptide n=1 Tax=Anopheles braziliensis TaxID=58242 RepID=A0A2M3ZMY4_9DIPT